MPERGMTDASSKLLTTSTFTVGALIVLCVIAPPAETSMRLCGEKLTRTLMAVCNNKLCGGFMADALVKRSGVASLFDLIGGRHLFSSAENRRAKRDEMMSSGVATECCTNKCSYAFLKTFCCDER